MTDTQGTQTIERIDYRKEGVEMGVITPTFSEWLADRDTGEGLTSEEALPIVVGLLTLYLDTYGPGSR